MIKKKNRKWLWLVAMVLLLTNWPAFKNITGINDWYYRYSNGSGTFTSLEEPKHGRMFRKYLKDAFILNKSNTYGCVTTLQSDTIVYRLFAVNPLKFWRWGEYIFDWRYHRLRYTDWEAIKKKRGFGNLKISKGCMEF